MYVSSHAPIGAIIGKLVPHPMLAFILGILSHYLTDLIPHGDKNIVAELKEWTGVKEYFTYNVADGFFLIVTILVILHYTPETTYWSVTAGVLGAVVPDFANAIGWLSSKRYLKPLFTSHQWVHNTLANKITRFDFPTKWLAFYLAQLPFYIAGLTIFTVL